MNKLLTTIILLCFSVAANAETYVCTADNYMHTFDREAERFKHVIRANFNDGTSTTFDSGYWNLEMETDSWLFLSKISVDDLDAALQAIIINKETGQYVKDSVRSIEFEARKETGNCVVV